MGVSPHQYGVISRFGRRKELVELSWFRGPLGGGTRVGSINVLARPPNRLASWIFNQPNYFSPPVETSAKRQRPRSRLRRIKRENIGAMMS